MEQEKIEKGDSDMSEVTVDYPAPLLEKAYGVVEKMTGDSEEIPGTNGLILVRKNTKAYYDRTEDETVLICPLPGTDFCVCSQ
jgi:hypothetical protein